MKEYVDGGLVIGYGTPEGAPMKVLRLGNSEAQSGGDDGYIHDLSQPGNRSPSRRSTRRPSSRSRRCIGVDYVHSPDKSAIESHANTILEGATEIAEQRNMKDTYRYIIWPFALLLGGLLAWEGANLALRAQQLRNSHAL